MTKKGHTMTGILTSVASVMVGVSMLLSSAGCAPTQPPTKPKAIPQVLWDVLWDKDGFKEANKSDYINTTNGGVNLDTYMFRTTNHYKMKCDVSGTTPGHGVQLVNCYGGIPIPGSRKHIPLSPISSTKLPVKYGALLLTIDNESGFATSSDPTNDGFAWSFPLKVLPVGYKLVFPKEDPKSFLKGTAYQYQNLKYNRKLVCVVPDKYSFGCIRSDNHGFFLDLYGTHTF